MKLSQVENSTGNGVRNFLLLLASSLVVMAGATHVPSLDLLGNVFTKGNGDFISQIFLVLPTFFLAFASPFAGGLIDRYGRKTLLVISSFLVGFGGMSGFFLGNPTALLFSRALVGIGLSGAMTASTTLIADYFEGEARHRFLGWQSSFMCFSGVGFLLIGGWLAQWGWQAPFLIYFIALLLGFMAKKFITEPKRKIPQEAFQKGKETCVLPKFLLGCLYIVGFLSAMNFYVIPSQLSFLLKKLVSATSLQISLAFAFSTLMSAFVAMQYQHAKKRMSFSRIFIVVFSMVGAGYLLVFTAKTYWMVFIGLSVAGLGLGWQFANLNSWIVSRVPEFWRGRAVGGLNTANFLGQFVCPFLILPFSAKFGLASAFLGAGLISLSLAVAFLIYEFSNTKKVSLTFSDAKIRS